MARVKAVVTCLALLIGLCLLSLGLAPVTAGAQSSTSDELSTTHYPSDWAEPTSLTVGPDGGIWFTYTSDTGTAGVGRYDTSSGSTLWSDPGIKNPGNIVSGPDGDLWFTTAGTTFGKVSTTGAISYFSCPGPAITIQDLTIGPDGDVWFTTVEQQIGTVDSAGHCRFYSTGSAYPEDITTGPDGALWFTTASSAGIGRITTYGSISYFTSSGVRDPTSIASGSDGALWFVNADTDQGAGPLGRVTTDGTFSFYNDDFIGAQIVAGPDHDLWSIGNLNSNPNRVYLDQITTSGQVTSYVVPDAIAEPTASLVVGPGGELWYGAHEALGRMTTSGTASIVALGNQLASSVRNLVNGPDGAIWFLDGYSGALGRITTTGQISAFLELGAVGEEGSLMVGSDGDFWMYDGSDVDRITPQGVKTSFADINTTSLVPGPDGTVWFSAGGPTGSPRPAGIYSIDESGTIKLIELTPPWPVPLVPGADGQSVWYVLSGNLHKVSADGTDIAYSGSDIQAEGPMVVQPDGEVWFGHSDGTVSRMAANGTVTEVPLPNGLSYEPGFSLTWSYPMISGPDGAVWIETAGGTDRVTVDGAITYYPQLFLSSAVVGPDGDFWSAGYGIQRIAPPADPPQVTGINVSDDIAGDQAEYQIDLTTSGNGAVPSSGQSCPEDCSVTLTAPAGTALPAAPVDYSIVGDSGSQEATVGVVALSQADDPYTGLTSSTLNQAKLTLVSSSIAAEDQLTITIDGVINPTDAIAGTGMLASTSADPAEGSPVYSIVPGPTAQVAFSTDKSTTAGATGNVFVYAADRFGNPVDGVPLTVTSPLTDPTATFDSCQIASSDSGHICTNATQPSFDPESEQMDAMATFDLTASDMAGTFPITVTAPNGPSAQIEFTNTAGSPAAVQILSGSPQTAIVNTSFSEPLSVKVVDRFGNPIPGVDMVFLPENPGFKATARFNCGSVDNYCYVVTDKDGVATAPPPRAYGASGTYPMVAEQNVDAYDQPYAEFQFTNVSPPDRLHLENQYLYVAPAQTAAVSHTYQPLVVQATDASGAPVSGVSVLFSAPSSGPSGTFAPCPGGNPQPWECLVVTGSDGTATATLVAGSRPGSFDVQATSSIGTVTFPLTNVPGPVQSLAVVSGGSQNAVIDHPFAQPVVIKATDSDGNPVAGSRIMLAVPASGPSATMAGGCTAASNGWCFTYATTGADGEATSPALTANNQAGRFEFAALTTTGPSTISTSTTLNNLPAPVVPPPTPPQGYRMVSSDGHLYSYGSDPALSRSGGDAPTAGTVSAASDPAAAGVWTVNRAGAVTTYGAARFWGSLAGIRLSQPIVGIAATPSGNGYWLVASDGGIFSFGDAHFHGSTGSIHLAQPIVGMAATPTGNGYWLVASDGG
ncbi:MAG TPA: hypothetical protein VG435_14245, partial [Acidimicrobiales bacterium]|nr:hypothetical protein [Acidimicrobiales bacterium]